jgi:hypothetical protein
MSVKLGINLSEWKKVNFEFANFAALFQSSNFCVHSFEVRGRSLIC